MLYLVKHTLFISISLWILEYVDAISVSPFFFLPLAAFLLCIFVKDKKGLATSYFIYRYIDLECTLAFILAASRLFEPYSLSPLLIIHLPTKEIEGKGCLVYVTNL